LIGNTKKRIISVHKIVKNFEQNVFLSGCNLVPKGHASNPLLCVGAFYMRFLSSVAIRNNPRLSAPAHLQSTESLRNLKWPDGRECEPHS